MAATLDGRVEATGAVFEAKFMLPWSFSEEAAAEKYMPQLQHNMWVVAARTAVLSVITGGGKWVEIKTHADPLYQHLIVTAERKFWRCVESGEPPRLFGVEPPKRIAVQAAPTPTIATRRNAQAMDEYRRRLDRTQIKLCALLTALLFIGLLILPRIGQDICIAIIAAVYIRVTLVIAMYCGPVLRHSAGLIQAANFRSAVVF